MLYMGYYDAVGYFGHLDEFGLNMAKTSLKRGYNNGIVSYLKDLSPVTK